MNFKGNMESKKINYFFNSVLVSRIFAYLIKRIGILILVLTTVSILTFSVTRMAGTPLYAAIGVYSTKEMIEDRKENDENKEGPINNTSRKKRKKRRRK